MGILLGMQTLNNHSNAIINNMEIDLDRWHMKNTVEMHIGYGGGEEQEVEGKRKNMNHVTKEKFS